MSEKPPCECIQKIDGRWTYRCECSNGGSAEYAASWVADENAQDEIARLTAERDALTAENAAHNHAAVKYLVQIDELRAGVEKLRAALRQIAGIDVWDNSEQGYVDKARAALEASDE